MLRLRPYNPKDGEILSRWFSDEEGFTEWSAGQFAYPLNGEQLDDYYRKWTSQGDGWPMAAVDENGRLAGHLLMRSADYEENSLFFGFIAVDPALRGKGLGKEMISLALAYAFQILKVDTVRLRVFKNNPGARRCYEAEGFLPEIVTEKAFSYKGEWWDNIQMAVRRQDWETKSWLSWARKLQFIAQAGLTYSKDPYDLERFGQIREISAEMVSLQSGLPIERVRDLFCNETGFQTPKLDTRAVIVENGKILLVQESDGRWSLPGGWVDVDQSIGGNTEKETLEEAGLRVKALRILAVQDRNRHNRPVYLYGVIKIFVQCRVFGGAFAPNIETVDSRYFSLEELPPLAEEKNTAEQIALCIKAAESPVWEPVFD